MGLIHSPRIVTDGLVMCLDAANSRSYPSAGTTWTDLSDNGNDGTLTNGPTFSSANGGSIVFDGTNDHIEIEGDVPDTENRTLSGWIKLDALVSSTLIACCKVSGSSSAQTKISLGIYNGGLYAAVQRSSTIAFPTYSVSDIFSNWLFAAATFSKSGSVWTANLYLNGLFRSTESGSYASSLGLNETLIGSTKRENGALNSLTDGRISSAFIHNRPLTADEIMQNYLATKGRYE